MGLDPENKVYDLYARKYIPRNYIIGKDGKVIYMELGFESFDEIVKVIEKALGTATADCCSGD